MKVTLRALWLLALWAALLAGGALGVFRPLDDALRDLRLGAIEREASGQYVFVEIDSPSLARVGVWPWPRHIHAQVLDTLMAMGADDTIFDVDFSSASTEAEDAALERALRDAGGYAYLAAFQQRLVTDGSIAYSVPLERFRAHAQPVSVNVAPDAAGQVRVAPYGITLDGVPVRSVAAVLSGRDGPVDAGFIIDYSIDPRTVDRISVTDILDGKVESSRIAGKKVVIGASAIELRDLFNVPRRGVLPGGLLQIVGAETLKQGRALGHIPLLPQALVVLIGLLSVLLARRAKLPIVLALTLLASVALEVGALALQAGSARLFDTAFVQAALALAVLQALVFEIQKRSRMHRVAARERDTTRRILDRVVADNFDGVVVVDEAGRIAAASATAELLLGNGLQGQVYRETLPHRLAIELDDVLSNPSAPEQVAPREIRLGDTGQNRVIEYVIRRSAVEVDGGTARVACLTFRDITERRRTEDRLRYLGTHDPLTGALSRSALVDHIRDLSAATGHAEFAVVAVDLRRFRAINDTLGHGSGDELLRLVVERLRAMGPDLVARLGGDSFVLLCPHSEARALTGFCNAVTAFLAHPYELEGGHQAMIAVSAGATTSILSGTDPDELLSHADMALSAAKQIAGNGVALFAPEMDARVRQRRQMDSSLRMAIANNELSLAFQPLFDLESETMLGVEALVRWRNADLGVVGPDVFIPVAEETGIIIEMGRWILNEACRSAAGWPDISVAVNVSPVQFELSNVVEDVIAALEGTQLPAIRLAIEITEGVFARRSERMLEQLDALRAMGVVIALDDFGTGYSSLSYLGRLPLDKIKIDQSFVKRLPGDAEAIAIIRTVIELGRSLGKSIVAEGIETADQAWMLRMMGCTVGQGYHFSRPVPAREISALLAPRARLAVSA